MRKEKYKVVELSRCVMCDKKIENNTRYFRLGVCSSECLKSKFNLRLHSQSAERRDGR
jgi:hypothetical protein